MRIFPATVDPEKQNPMKHAWGFAYCTIFRREDGY